MKYCCSVLGITARRARASDILTFPGCVLCWNQIRISMIEGLGVSPSCASSNSVWSTPASCELKAISYQSTRGLDQNRMLRSYAQVCACGYVGACVWVCVRPYACASRAGEAQRNRERTGAHVCVRVHLDTTRHGKVLRR